MVRLLPVDYVIVAVYFLAMIGIGVYFSRRQKGGADFFAGGRRIPWWVAGISLYMANFSAFMYSGSAALTYETGLFAILSMFGLPLSYLVGTLLTATRWRRTRSVSPVEFTRTRFTPGTQRVIAVVVGVLFLLTTGTQLFSVCTLVAPAMQIGVPLTIVGVGLIALLYATSGGLWAVTVCDVLQFVILMGVTAAVVPLAIGEVGGARAFVERLPPLDWNVRHGDMSFDPLFLLGNTTMFALGVAQGGGQMFYSVKDEKSARRVGFFAALLFLANPILFGVVPLAARMLWPTVADIPAPPETRKPEYQVFLLMCFRLLPAGTIGFFLAAALSATMDNLSVTANMLSSLFTRDLFPIFSKRTLTEEAQLRMGRIASAAVGVAVVAMALIAYLLDRGGKTLYGQMVTYISLLAPPITIPIVLGLMLKRFPRWGAAAAIVWNLTLGLTAQFFLGWTIGPRLTLVLGGTLTLCLLTPVLASRPRMTGLGVTSLLLAFFEGIRFEAFGWPQHVAAAGAALIMGMAVAFFGSLFAKETDEDRRPVEDFFKTLATPVDVEREVMSG